MICKDCRPIFYGVDEEVPDPEFCNVFRVHRAPSGRLVLKHIELCPRHAEAEAMMDTAGALVAHLDDEQRERRRYALLQAAVRLIGPILIVLHDDEVYQKRIRQGVDAAEALLAEIEHREKAKDLLIKALNAAIQERGGQ